MLSNSIYEESYATKYILVILILQVINSSYRIHITYILCKFLKFRTTLQYIKNEIYFGLLHKNRKSGTLTLSNVFKTCVYAAGVTCNMYGGFHDLTKTCTYAGILFSKKLKVNERNYLLIYRWTNFVLFH